MANVKISELPAASTLGSTDLVAVVQADGTKQATAAAFFTQQSAYAPGGTGPASQTPLAKIRRDAPHSPEDRGCVGDGTTDDTANFGVFLDNASNKTNILTGTYKLTSILAKAISNARLIGIPGLTKITGAFDYAVIKFLALNNVFFYGITFESTYTNAVEDTGKSVVYTNQTDVKEVRFQKCKFTSPNANTSGFTVYARTSAGDTSAVIDGLWVEDCDFIDVGRIGCTLMNRGTGSDKFTAARRVYFNRNHGKNMGISGSHGFLISLDGYGSNFQIDNNLVEKALGIGIENTGWVEGSVSYNEFDDFSRSYAPLSFSGTTMTGLTVIGNKTRSAATIQCSIYNVDHSRFMFNQLEINATNGNSAAKLRDSNDNQFAFNRWLNSATNGSSAMNLEYSSVGCKRNRFYYDNFDDSASASNLSLIRFDGASCSENIVHEPIYKRGTGGLYIDEVNSANNNFQSGSPTAGSGTDLFNQNISSPNFASDANKTLTAAEYSAQLIRMTDSGVLLTTGRTVTLPVQKKVWMVYNSTAQTLTFAVTGFPGFAVTTTNKAFVWFTGGGVEGVII